MIYTAAVMVPLSLDISHVTSDTMPFASCNSQFPMDKVFLRTDILQSCQSAPAINASQANQLTLNPSFTGPTKDDLRLRMI